MSCNGCRVLRKGCSDTCILRSSLQWIESPEAQGHATVFVAKFFGRAGMISFISAVSESQRPALFQSLLYEACGRTVNPVFGAVGLLWSGNWGLCQAAVETVLKGGSLRPSACLPAVPTKPMQPITNKSQAPSTHPSPALANNPSLKRPHRMIDSKICADIKRPRSSDQHQKIPDLRSEAANLHQEQINAVIIKPVVSSVVSKPAELCAKPEIVIQEEMPTPSGQLVAPVARRVRPRVGYGSAAMVREQACEVQERHIEESHETIELDLTLNSHANPTNMNGWKMASPGVVRVSSPSSFSVNSEGSVTSSDTAEFSVSCVRTLSPQGHEERQLLHLLNLN